MPRCQGCQPPYAKKEEYIVPKRGVKRQKEELKEELKFKKRGVKAIAFFSLNIIIVLFYMNKTTTSLYSIHALRKFKIIFQGISIIYCYQRRFAPLAAARGGTAVPCAAACAVRRSLRRAPRRRVALQATLLASRVEDGACGPMRRVPRRPHHIGNSRPQLDGTPQGQSFHYKIDLTNSQNKNSRYKKEEHFA